MFRFRAVCFLDDVALLRKVSPILGVCVGIQKVRVTPFRVAPDVNMLDVQHQHRGATVYLLYEPNVVTSQIA